MRHRRSGKHLGRNTSARQALARSLMVGLFISPKRRIVTTIAKAKWVKGAADSLACQVARILALESDGSVERIEVVNAHRKLAKVLGRREDVAAVVRAGREHNALKLSGGNIRVLRLPGYRIGDAGQKAVVELV